MTYAQGLYKNVNKIVYTTIYFLGVIMMLISPMLLITAQNIKSWCTNVKSVILQLLHCHYVQNFLSWHYFDSSISEKLRFGVIVWEVDINR